MYLVLLLILFILLCWLCQVPILPTTWKSFWTLGRPSLGWNARHLDTPIRSRRLRLYGTRGAKNGLRVGEVVYQTPKMGGGDHLMMMLYHIYHILPSWIRCYGSRWSFRTPQNHPRLLNWCLRLLLLEKQQKWGSQYQCMLHCLCCERLFFLVLWKQYARRHHHIFMENSSSWLRQHDSGTISEHRWKSLELCWLTNVNVLNIGVYQIALPCGKLVHKSYWTWPSRFIVSFP